MSSRLRRPEPKKGLSTGAKVAIVIVIVVVVLIIIGVIIWLLLSSQPSGGNGGNGGNGAISCTSDDDCPISTIGKCNTGTGVCQQCLINDDCDANETCTAGACVPTGCSDDNDCTSPNPACNTSNVCVQCTTTNTTECETGETCENNMCVCANVGTVTDLDVTYDGPGSISGTFTPELDTSYEVEVYRTVPSVQLIAMGVGVAGEFAIGFAPEAGILTVRIRGTNMCGSIGAWSADFVICQWLQPAIQAVLVTPQGGMSYQFQIVLSDTGGSGHFEFEVWTGMNGTGSMVVSAVGIGPSPVTVITSATVVLSGTYHLRIRGTTAPCLASDWSGDAAFFI